MAAGQQTSFHAGDKVEGDKVEGDKVEGDKVINNLFNEFVNSKTIHQHFQQDDAFEEVGLGDYAPPYFAPLRNVDKLVEQVRSEHMLIVDGDLSLDLYSITCSIAWHVYTKLISPTSTSTQASSILWNISPDVSQLKSKLRNTKIPTIFIAPDASPKDIRSAQVLVDIHDLARSHQHYVIMATDGYGDWKYSGTIAACWCNLPLPSKERLFNVESLRDMLTITMEQQEAGLPPGRLRRNADSTMLLSDRYTPQEVAKCLNIPRDVSGLARRIAHSLRYNSVLSDAQIKELIDAILTEHKTKPEELLRDVYTSRLSPRAQLLALNLTFLGDLYEDQFFAATERLVERVWRIRDPQLCAFDYDDLDSLGQLFVFGPTGERGARLIRLPSNQRLVLLDLAWQRDRRRVLAALPALTDLVVQSVKPKPQDFELYLSENYCSLIRTVLGETLSDIGLIDEHGVELALLRLAAYDDLRIQIVTAQAIARWYYLGRKDKVFVLIGEWWKQAGRLPLRQMIEAFQGERKHIAQTPAAYLKATVVLIVGAVATYDAPNQLNSRLYDLFAEMGNDSNKIVRDRLENYTLPVITRIHLEQVRPVLRNMTHRGLEEAVAKSLADAYEGSSFQIRDTLNLWWGECETLRPALPEDEPTIRENLLATIALTLGFIDYTKNRLLTTAWAIGQLRILLRRESHPLIRKAAMVAITRIAEQDFAGVANFLHEAVKSVSDEERNIVVASFRQLYISQLQQFQGDETFFLLNSRQYLPVWLPPSKPPFTPIERVLIAWTKNSRNAIAQQLAVRALAAIEPMRRALEEEGKRRADEHKQDENKLTQAPIPDFQPLIVQGWYSGFIVPTLASIGVWQYEPIIWNTLPEVLAHHRDLNRRDNIESLLRRWSSLQDHEIVLIARRLRAALWMSNHGVTVMFVLILLVVSISFMLLQVVTLLTNRA